MPALRLRPAALTAGWDGRTGAIEGLDFSRRESATEQLHLVHTGGKRAFVVADEQIGTGVKPAP
jgi:hypothetical protein